MQEWFATVCTHSSQAYLMRLMAHHVLHEHEVTHHGMSHQREYLAKLTYGCHRPAAPPRIESKPESQDSISDSVSSQSWHNGSQPGRRAAATVLKKHLSGAFCRILCENASNQTPHLQHYEHEQTQLDSIIYQEYCNRGIINCNSILLYIQSLHAQCSTSFVRTRGAYLAISFT